MPDFRKIYLYRMTHIENIPHIFKYGLTHRNSNNANPNYVPIGDNSLINTRNTRTLANGRLLGDYIPFYFGYRTPMLFVIQKGLNGVSPTIAENIVYCVTSVKEVLDSDIDFIFTDGHAIDSFTSEFNKEQIASIDDILDFEAIKAIFWKDENDLDKKRRKEAEFLLEQDLPNNHILGYICFNEAAKAKLIGFGIDQIKIVIKPNYYF